MPPFPAIGPFLHSVISSFLWASLSLIPHWALASLLNMLFPETSKPQQVQNPSVVKTVLSRLLYISPTSTKLDLKSELTVRTIRAVINQPKQPTITAYQAANGYDRPTKRPIGASRVLLATNNEDDVRKTLCLVVKLLGNGSENITPPHMAHIRG